MVEAKGLQVTSFINNVTVYTRSNIMKDASQLSRGLKTVSE